MRVFGSGELRQEVGLQRSIEIVTETGRGLDTLVVDCLFSNHSASFAAMNRPSGSGQLMFISLQLTWGGWSSIMEMKLSRTKRTKPSLFDMDLSVPKKLLLARS